MHWVPAMEQTEDPADSLRIDQLQQIEILGSSVRQEISDVVAALSPCSIAEVGRQLHRSPHSLYYHFRILVRAGLLSAAGARRTKRREEALYTTPARRMYLRYDPSSSTNVEAVCRVAASMARVAVRDFRRGFRPDLAVVSGPRRNLWAARTTGWLSEDELQDLNEHLERILELLSHNRSRNGRRLYALTWTLAPLAIARSGTEGDRSAS